MTLSAEKLVTVIQEFSYDLSTAVEFLNGFVQKYVGDAPSLHFFPLGFGF